jgi:hypothetical protein
MSIQLNKAYKIISYKQKRYTEHYKIPAQQALVVPLKKFGDDVSCDVRWENTNGELQVLNSILINVENIVPLNPMIDDKLQEIWDHYYGSTTEAQPQQDQS